MNKLSAYFYRLRNQKLVIPLDRSDRTHLVNLIDTVRRMETNTSLYAAGAFAPLLVLLSQLEFLVNQNSDLARIFALLAMFLLAFSGITLVLYRALYINIKRTEVELYLAGVYGDDPRVITALDTPNWNTLNVFAFVTMPL